MRKKDETQTMLDSMNDLLRQQEEALGEIQADADCEDTNTTNDESGIMTKNMEDIMNGISIMFADDEEFIKLLFSMNGPAEGKISEDGIDQPVHTEPAKCDFETQSIEAAQPPDKPEELFDPVPLSVLAESVSNPPSEKYIQPPLESEENPRTEETRITPQQLKALSRKHLMIMLSDLEKELKRVNKENQNMILAYKAGIAQGQRP